MQSGQLSSVCIFLQKTKEEMNMEYRLSSSEREFAEAHHNLIYAFLNKEKLDQGEFYDVAALAYLKAVRRYFINKNLVDYNFSTIAWTAMKSAVIKEKKKQKSNFVSLDEPAYREGVVTLIDSLGKEDNFDEKIIYLDLVRKVKPNLTVKQNETLCKRADGFKYSELAEKAGITKSGIGSRLSRARRKLKLVFVEGDDIA